jgi:hypothetical protein
MCLASWICNIVVRLCCFGGGGVVVVNTGGGSCSILECCAMLYCYYKVKTCCTAMGTKISNCFESTKNNIDGDVILAGTGQIDSAEEHV